MDVYNLEASELRNGFGYHGCGKAWAAKTQKGNIAAIIYMGSMRVIFDRFRPETAEEFLAEWRKIHPRMEPPKNTGRIGRWTQFCADLNAQREQAQLVANGGFPAWRNEQRAKLAELAGDEGAVLSGMCSCWEFCTE